MSYSLESSNELVALADAIRAKTGDSNTMTVAEMALAVAGITGGSDGLGSFDITEFDDDGRDTISKNGGYQSYDLNIGYDSFIFYLRYNDMSSSITVYDTYTDVIYLEPTGENNNFTGSVISGGGRSPGFDNNATTKYTFVFNSTTNTTWVRIDNKDTDTASGNYTYQAKDMKILSGGMITLRDHTDAIAGNTVLTGNADHIFSYANNTFYSWVLPTFKDRITTSDITTATDMFSYNTDITSIPFVINYTMQTGTNNKFTSMFRGCTNLKSIAGIVTTVPSGMSATVGNVYLEDMFNGCQNLETVPSDLFEKMKLDEIRTYFNANGGFRIWNLFGGCHKLKSHPNVSMLNELSTNGVNYAVYRNIFSDCHCLREIKNLPVVTDTVTSNMLTFSGFTGFATNDYMCSRITFAKNNNSPITAQWKNQTIIYQYVGYHQESNPSDTENFPASKRVTDAASYAALKNTEDWWTSDITYSRYNHDSAVETINSLPDTSAYLATAGGTNTISFVSTQGSNTDAGGLGTLTAAEIAVATAKGWTVSLV